MEQYEELIILLDIATQEWEQSILRLWIERDGIDRVYEECTQMIRDAEKHK